MDDKEDREFIDPALARKLDPMGAEAAELPPGAIAEHRLYVSNLDLRVTELHVAKVFKKYGTIVNLAYMWHVNGPLKGQPKGACYVEFGDRRTAEAAQKATHGKKLLGRPISVQFVADRVQDKLGAAVPSEREYGRDEVAARQKAMQAKASKVSDAKFEAIYDAKVKAVRARIEQLKKRQRRE